MSSSKEKNHKITPIREEQDTINSKKGCGASHPKSQTYSNADRVDLAGASVHSYSEIYESATRESIDENYQDLKS